MYRVEPEYNAHPSLHGLQKSLNITPYGTDMDMHLFVNLTDQKLYDADCKLVSTIDDYKGLCNKVIDKFAMLPLVNWFNGGKVFDDYNEMLESEEFKMKLEIHNRWIKHNLSLLENTKSEENIIKS